MDLKKKKQTLVANVIIDEVILDNNLSELNKNRKWLEHELKILGFDGVKGILLATVDENNKLNIYRKNEELVHGSLLE